MRIMIEIPREFEEHFKDDAFEDSLRRLSADAHSLAWSYEKVIRMIMAERARQNEMWGDQSGNHPFEWMSILGEEYGELCQAVNESCFKNGKHPEFGGVDNVIKEAVQVATVAVAIIEQFERCGKLKEGGK